MNNNAPPPNIMKTLGNYSKLYNRWRVFGNHILYKSSLPLREKEVLILRIGWLCNSEYEWAQHSVIGKRAGLSDEEILRIREGPDADGWEPFDALLLRAVDELYIDSFISDATWNKLAETYDKLQLMDLVFTVGQYNLVSMVLNSLGLQLEEGMKGFPKS
jgi:4-carboxymuconolactone decarboxylase